MNLPMLLKNFEDTPVIYPTWTERKYDGIRCVVIVSADGTGAAYSREGRRLLCVQAIADTVAAAMGAGVVVDGELDAGTWGLTQSALKRGDGAPLLYRPFDAVSLIDWEAGGTEAPLMARRRRLDVLRGAPGVEVVDGVYAFSESKLGEMFMDAVAAGWEGLCVKSPGSGYTCGERSGNWQKLKPAGAS